ncbi:pleckstrin homology domain-containing family G member 1 isoform X1 [Hemiscyllium ocellatum]|uniref:pleckstrin homology domain-containing family G member 1 isoform X1 n=2 Tax=Hemiscyllium ocellatum TaxID=170820 RepID=UPI0029677056|nr:pleckstrin homology domain-containing family G member 1 isoform X1 [Hemiscyllium ocellatum]XP_060687741.1 pleckstrin homology domain-containing family G member 1 isoform X1 [Hemiscyllium ocellatum]
MEQTKKISDDLENMLAVFNEYRVLPDVLPPVRESLSRRATLTAPVGFLHTDNRRYGGTRSMDSSDRDRPVSYSSTSSSASSRDSHCSLSSGMTLVSNSQLGLPGQEKEAGAIRLELIPAGHLSGTDDCAKVNLPHTNSGELDVKRPGVIGIKRVDSRVPHKNRAMSPGAASASPKLLYVDRVVQEILETERTYVEDLRSIVKDYLDCITDQLRLPLGTEERLALFGNIRDIYRFNSDLLQDLESCDSDPVAIAECFVAKSEEFHIYTQYCTNYPRSVAVLTECMRNKVLAKFFREQQESLKHSLPLGSYLLKPVQRILKYHLLLHEIANHLEKDTECYDVVQDAIDTMQRVAWHINDMKRKHEHAVRLQEIQSLLTNWKGPDLTSYGELVLEGTFRIQRAKNERTLFLLDKLLLITKKREETYTYKAHILCCNLMLVEVIPKEPLSFSVFHYKNPKVQHTVQAKSTQDKRLWILHLKRLILENHPAKIPAKAKQAILEMDAIHHPGFHYSPEGERKAESRVKEDRITPRRLRRKSEPSARLKSAKQLERRQDKRASIEGSLLSPSMEVLSSSSKCEISALGHGDTVNQSQESLDPAYPSDQEDSVQLRTLEQTDADDEEEVDIDQVSSKSSTDDSRLFNVHFECWNSQPVTHTAEQIETTGSVCGLLDMELRDVWTEPLNGRASFPSQALSHGGRGGDDYQKFVTTASTPNLSSTPIRPLYHSSNIPNNGRTETSALDYLCAGTERRVVRRASSAGERHLASRHRPPADSHSRTTPGISSSQTSAARNASSAKSEGLDEEMRNSQVAVNLRSNTTEGIYENIMLASEERLAEEQQEVTCSPGDITGASFQSSGQAEKKHQHGNLSHKNVEIQERWEGRASSIHLTETGLVSGQNSPALPKWELKTVESLNERLVLPEKAHTKLKNDWEECSKRHSFLAPDSDLSSCGLGGFVSEESLRFSGDEAPNLNHLMEKSQSGWNSSANSHCESRESIPDKLSEEVDEIWNDLEDYIRKSEETRRDRLPAAFPVSEDDLSRPASTHESQRGRSLACSTKVCPSFVEAVKNKSGRLSTCSVKTDSSEPSGEASVLTASVASLDGEVVETECLWRSTNVETDVQDLDIMDRTKRRVYYMARQYSQKIKKANQLLKMKNTAEQSPSDQPKRKCKDLVAILEEKKQGGTAIGARIAEYSQLYDQFLFKETPSKSSPSVPVDNSGEVCAQKTMQSPVSGHPSHGQSLGTEDWLLHSTYSNGELADFVAWPDIQGLAAKYSIQEKNVTNGRLQSRGGLAGSVPSVAACPSVPMQQRWSAIIVPPGGSDCSMAHGYNSLGRRTSEGKQRETLLPSPAVITSQSSDSINHALDKQALFSSWDPASDRLHVGNQEIEEPALTLRDSQKVVVVNRVPPLDAQLATQNYFANFNDTGEDDEDYVEIKSEDEDYEDLDEGTFTHDLSFHFNGKAESTPEPGNTRLARASCIPLSDSDAMGSLTMLAEPDQLSHYLWREPSPSQQNIVQTLRDKFQCLSSSSFA